MLRRLLLVLGAIGALPACVTDDPGGAAADAPDPLWEAFKQSAVKIADHPDRYLFGGDMVAVGEDGRCVVGGIALHLGGEGRIGIHRHLHLAFQHLAATGRANAGLACIGRIHVGGERRIQDALSLGRYGEAARRTIQRDGRLDAGS